MRKILISILAILLILASIFLAKKIVDSKKSFKPEAEKVIKTVYAQKVKNGIVPIIVPANGILMAKKRIELYSEVQGVFLRGNKLFKEGQLFNRGDIIISIDASEYKATVQSAKSNLYNQLTSIMPDLRLDYPDIFSKWQNYLTNFDMNKSTPQLPELLTEKEKFFITGRGILPSYYNLKNLEQRLSKYKIIAPYSGILTEVLVTEGTLIRTGQKLGEFINEDVYELEVSVSKTYSDLLKIGEKVKLKDLENRTTYTGKVARINGKVDPASQTIKAFVEVTDKRLKEGMYLEANLNAKQEMKAIEVDRNLLLNNDQIFVVRDTVLELINVNPVYFTDKSVVLKSVPDGTLIITKPLVGAYTGMAVKVFKEKPINAKE